MRYPAERKQASRQRILAAASAAFRERGLAAAGIDEIMRRAGLTHGGFYAHFADKDELVAEACLSVFEEAVVNLDRIAARPSPAERARLLIDSYLSGRHRDNRGSGCLVVAVAADIARLEGRARRGYARGFARHLERLAGALRLAEDPALNRTRTVSLLSALVGALLVARAIDDPAASDEVLRTMRERLRAEYGRESFPLDGRPTATSPGGPRPTNDFLVAHSTFLS